MIRITIKTDNAAFQDDPLHEIARILRRVAEDMVRGLPCEVRDINGNQCGEVARTGKDRNF